MSAMGRKRSFGQAMGLSGCLYRGGGREDLAAETRQATRASPLDAPHPRGAVNRDNNLKRYST